MTSKPKQKLSAAAKKRKYGGGHTSSSRLERNATCMIGTCDKGKENMATIQLLTWMQTYVDDMYPVKVQEETKEELDVDVEEDEKDDGEEDEKQDGDGSGSDDDDDDPFGDGSAPTSKRARITPPAASTDDDDRPSCISSALAAELAALKEEEKASRQQQQAQKKGKEKSKDGKKIKKPRARLESIDTKMKGLILVYIRDPTIQLIPLLTRMLMDVRIKKELSSRNIIRLEPVEKTCFAGLSELDTLCSTFLPAAFASLPSTITTHTFAIVLERRGHHDRMERNACIQTIAKHVPSPWTVNLRSPSVVIMATVLNRIAGLSVVTNYYELNKYNVRQLYEHATGIQQEKKQNQNNKQNSQNNNNNSNSTTSTETFTSTTASSNSHSSTSTSTSTLTSTSTSASSSSSTSSIT